MDEGRPTNGASPPVDPGDSLLHSFLAAVPHAVIVCDDAGRIVSANVAVRTLLGYDESALVGQPMEVLIPSRLRGRHEAMRAGFASSGTTRMLRPARELLALRADGAEIPVAIGIAVWHAPQGRRLIASLIDGSDRKRAEADADAQHQAAVEAGELAEAIIAESASGIVLYDAESGQCVSANERAARIVGLTVEQILAQRFREIASWQRSTLLGCAEHTIATGKATRTEAQLVTSGGRDVVLECEFLLVTRRDRPHLVHIINDLTDRRNLEAQLRVAQKMEAVAQLAGGVAHDFNNLLTVIGTYTTLLIDEVPPDDPKRTDLEEILGASTRAAALTRQLLAFGRRQLLDTRLVNVNAIVEGVEKMLRRVLSAEIQLEFALDPTLGAINADAGQVEQALMNLVVNARDAMARRGTITVRTANVEVVPTPTELPLPRDRAPHPVQMVMLSVTDTGAGIDPETMSHIFEPFFTTKGPGRGTGLGLSTTHGIMKQSGGFIRVHSTLGAGTRFELYFPRVTTGSAAIVADTVAQQDVPGSGEILVVEDDPHVRRIVVAALRDRGYAVVEATDGAEAIGWAAQRDTPPDLVLTDVIMPRVNGLELARHLRERWPGLRVLFCSAYAPDDWGKDGSLEAHDILLRKPFVPSELGVAVHEALAKPAGTAR